MNNTELKVVACQEEVVGVITGATEGFSKTDSYYALRVVCVIPGDEDRQEFSLFAPQTTDMTLMAEQVDNLPDDRDFIYGRNIRVVIRAVRRACLAAVKHENDHRILMHPYLRASILSSGASGAGS